MSETLKRRQSWGFATSIVGLGFGVVALWLLLRETLQGLAQATVFRWVYLVPLLALIGLWIFARFIRWQFLLRRAHVRIPTRHSLAIYLAALVGAATPAYAGEFIASPLLRQDFGEPLKTTAWVIVIERLLDVLAISLLGLVVSNGTDRSNTPFYRVLATSVLLVGAVGLSRFATSKLESRSEIGRPIVLLQALGISAVVWMPLVAVVALVGSSLGIHLGLLTSARTLVSSGMLGKSATMLAGLGSMGIAGLQPLRADGVSPASSLVIMSGARLLLIGLPLILSLVFLARRLLSLPASLKEIHFDQIASQYKAQWSEHVWDHLLRRKTDLMCAALPNEAHVGRGLDLGCGLGIQCDAMAHRGFQMIGIDQSSGLVRQASARGVRALVGDATRLPFPDNSLDFVYTVGVLHHLPGIGAQRAAVREVARVLKPGGSFMVHESNPRNPLFRFYMGYLFPLLKTIDEGTEVWIGPGFWETTQSPQLVALHYFTFLPDFIPRALLHAASRIERWLESSSLREFSVHYMAVMHKMGDASIRELKAAPTLAARAHEGPRSG